MKTDFPAVPRNPQSNFTNLRMGDMARLESSSDFWEHESSLPRNIV